MSEFNRLRASLHPEEKIVKGANVLRHFNVRCPECSKLFRVDSREIKSSSPQFQCSACKTEFSFSYPPVDLRKIETKVVRLPRDWQLAEQDIKEPLPQELKNCPKCLALNPKNRNECIKCQVIFSKVEGLPLQKELGALPSLIRAWQDLLSDYNNLKKHMAFVDRCDELQALPFALKKYQSLKEAQPQDAFTQEMIKHVLVKGIKESPVAKPWASAVQVLVRLNSKINWFLVGKLSPLAASFALILMGAMSQSNKNMIGVGVSILFLTLGLTIFIKGRIKISDLWS